MGSSVRDCECKPAYWASDGSVYRPSYLPSEDKTMSWATEKDLEKRGMLGRESGRILGRLYEPPTGHLTRNVGRLMRWDAKAGCLAFKNAVRTMWGQRQGPIVRMPESAVHSVVFSPTSGGKGVSCVIPHLLTDPNSAIVIDVKGELLKTGIRREEMGNEIVMLDPLGVTGIQSDTFNPLDWIDKHSPYAVDDCYFLADSLVIRTGKEHDQHWNNCALSNLAANFALTVYYGTEGQRSLQNVDEIACNPEVQEGAIEQMCEPDDTGVYPFDGVLARMGGAMKLYESKEKSSVLSSVAKFLQFTRSPSISRNLRTSSFDPNWLSKGKMTIYLVLPPDFMDEMHIGWLRMCITSLLRVVVKHGLQNHRNPRIVNVVFDEAASIGPLKLEKNWPVDKGLTLLSNCAKTYFGVNDPMTAKQVSEMIGSQLTMLRSGGSSWGTSNSYSESHRAGSRTYGGNRGGSEGWSEQLLPSLRPEAIAALPPDTAITFIQSMPPIMTKLIKYYQEPWLTKGHSWVERQKEAMGTLIWAAFFCGSMVAAAAFVTWLAIDFRALERFQAYFHHLSRGGR
jgi:type IV secretion system protein VirD4